MPITFTTAMGGRKFRLSTHRKNEERKRRQKRAEQKQNCLGDLSFLCLTVSLPVPVYHEGTVSTIASLSSRLLGSHCIPSTWVVARQIPLLLCKLSTQNTTASVSITLSVQHDFSWTVTVGSQWLSVRALSPLCQFTRNASQCFSCGQDTVHYRWFKVLLR